MNTLGKKSRYSLEEYFGMLELSDLRLEYYNGEIFAMAGGSYQHSLIKSNFNFEIRNALREKECTVHSSDLLIHIARVNSMVYPDSVVICGSPEFHEDNAQAILNPIVIGEVLSPSTRNWDVEGKRDQYKLLPSLREYVLLEQHEAKITVHRLVEDHGWEKFVFEGLEDEVELKSLDIRIPINSLYRGVELDPESPG